jgi:hypothetical protein
VRIRHLDLHQRRKFLAESGDEVWRPSENVVHELGAASIHYEERVVIFKEKGIDLPTKFKSIGISNSRTE